MISAEMASDIALFANEIRFELWTPIVSPPEFAFSGAQGMFSNSSRHFVTRVWLTNVWYARLRNLG